MDNTARHLDLCRPHSKWTPLKVEKVMVLERVSFEPVQEMGIGDLLPDQALLRIPAPVSHRISFCIASGQNMLLQPVREAILGAR